MISDPVAFEPGVYSYATFDDDPAIVFPLSYEEWINLLNPELSNTGILSEGDYLLRIEPIPTDPNSLIPTIPGVALFNIRYAEPPLLLTPPDEAAISAQLPIFTWTPVTGAPLGSTIEYELLITEVLSEQTPAQALESNIEQAHKALIEQTSFVYSPTELPLEPGKIYAWQVQARDVNDQLPIIDQGATEIYTFSILGEGLGTGLTAWSFPISSPFLRYEFDNQQEIDPNDSELFFDDYLPIELLGLVSNADFDNVLIDVESQRIIDGTVRIEDPFALELAINPLNDTFTGHRAVTSNSTLTLRDGLLINLGSDILIDVDGLHPKGTHPAQVSYSGYGTEQWTATYSEDLVLDFSPFRIVRGRIDFATEGIAKGYADQSGFHLSSQNDPVIAQLPDRLLINKGRFGHIPLKSGTRSLVNLEELDNAFKLSELRPGALELILPNLQQSYHSQPPRFEVTLEDVSIDPATGALIKGNITASLADSSQSYTLDHLGIPLAPREFRIEKSVDSTHIELEGWATLFGQPLMNVTPVTLQWESDQTIRGDVDLESLNSYIWLDPEKQHARLSISELQGRIETSLSSPIPQFRYDVKGQLDILSDANLVAQSDIELMYNGAGYATLNQISPKNIEAPGIFGNNNQAVYVDEITALDIFYSEQKGIEFSIALAAHLTTALKESASIEVPIWGAELTNSGFYIPVQEHHAGTPEFRRYAFDQGGHSFKLEAVRIPPTHIQSIALASETGETLSPSYDFELHLSKEAFSPSELAQIPLTIQDATIEDGVIVGSILPYTFINPLHWSLETGMYHIHAISGILVDQDGFQSEEVDYSGNLHLRHFQELPSCVVPNVQISQKSNVFEGSSPIFNPCGTLTIGSFDLDLGAGKIDVQTRSNNPSFIFEGELQNISHQERSGQSLEEPGEISIDLTSNSILSSSGTISSIDLVFPIENPLYEVQLTGVSLSDDGFSLPNGNSIEFNSISGENAYSFNIEKEFIFGWVPERTNVGQGELLYTGNENPEIVGTLDDSGFHPASRDTEFGLPGQIRLPDVSSVIIVLNNSDEYPAEIGRKTNEGITLRTHKDEPASLMLPLVDSGSDPILIPVPLNIKLNDAFAYLGGVIQADYSDDPIDLSASGYPLRITGVQFDPAMNEGQRLHIEGELKAPHPINGDLDSDEFLPFRGTFGARGLNGSLVSSESKEIYQDVLGMAIHDIHVSNASDVENLVLVKGELTSPLFASDQHSSQISIEGAYSSQSQHWTYKLADYQPNNLSIGTTQFRTDSESGYTLSTDSGIELSISGRFYYPEMLDPEFSLGAIIDIGRNGIVLWPNDELWNAKPLFGGVLSATIDAFDFTYDPANNAVITTIDGAFHPEFATSSINDNLIPFSNIQVSSDGALSIRGDSNQQDASNSGIEILNLLANQSPIRLLNDALTFDAITLVNDSSGLSLDLNGRLFLPNPGEYSPGVRLSRINTPLPLTIHVGHDGALKNLVFWNKGELDSLLSGASNGSNPIQYQGVLLDFDPKYPDNVQVLASATFYLDNLSETLGADPFDASDEPLTPTVLRGSQKGIPLGSSSNPLSHPGLLLRNQQPLSYLISDSPSLEKPLLSIKGTLTDLHATHVSLNSHREPVFSIRGRSFISLDGFSGYFPITDMTVSPRGITHPGTLAEPTALSFLNVASFELNCFENQQNSVSSTGQQEITSLIPASLSSTDATQNAFVSHIRFGRNCGSPLPMTFTDRWFVGTYDEFDLENETFSSTSLQINGVNLNFSRLASFKGALTYEFTGEQPYLLLDGETEYRSIALTSTGNLKTRDGLPSLSILFNPARQPLEVIPDFGLARIAGGGLFYRPNESEIGLVSLALNERTNNSFTSNNPNSQHATEIDKDDQLSLIAPIELSIESGRATLDFNGIGIIKDTEQHTYLDLDGAFYDESEQLQTDFFLLERRPQTGDQDNALVTLEGVANISLNYTSILGGVVPANLSLNYAPGEPLSWTAKGSSKFILTDTIELPGSLVMNPTGFALSLEDTIDIGQGHISIDDQINVSLWRQRDETDIQGYTSFTSSIDLLPGYMLNQENMYGALIKDRDEHQIYAARNQYADVPYIFNGPLDPWVAFQDGNTFGGDARSSVFRRMIQDARISSQKISGLTEAATTSLQNALNLQAAISQSPILAKNLSTFTQSDSLLSLLGNRVMQTNDQFIQDSSSSPLKAIQQELYEDEDHPGLNYVLRQPYASREALDAFGQMQSSIVQARRSADLDIYSFQTISPRPLLWLTDYVDLTPHLESSPLQLTDTNSTTPTFTVDPVKATQHITSLLAFKQNNESVDSQFLRAIAGLETNLINLKTVRSPEQAFDFEIANNSIRQFYTQQIADDWTMLDWLNGKKNWLTSQESRIEDGITEQLSTLSDTENPLEVLKQVSRAQYNLSIEIAQNTPWERDDLPEGTSYNQFINNLSDGDLRAEYQRSAKNMWYDAPLASLTMLSDSLSSLLNERITQFEIHSDTLNIVSDSFSKTLDPLYDVQTQYTTTLFGMADEYRIWRSSIRGLDPEEVNFSFQFTPYRGNYRILAEDLTPPIIDDIFVTPNTQNYLNETAINWETEHPVELAEISLSITESDSKETYFTSLATSTSTSYFTTKTNERELEKDLSLTLRVRGAGGIPVIKKGQFKVPVSPSSQANSDEELTLVPVDLTPPPSPVITGLSYSSYFSDTPNTLQFNVGALRDIDSGIEQVEYKIESGDGKNLVQDWTSLPISSTYFGGRLVETSLPVQEDDITVKVSVRITNGGGLTSISTQELALDLDVTAPSGSVKNLLYFDHFENSNPNSLAIEIIDISDEESGIEKVEYTITKEAQANLANANWNEFIPISTRPKRTGAQTIFIPLEDQLVAESTNNLSVFIRTTNGAGLQNVIRETIQIPGKDLSAPTEPSVSLGHTGFYATDTPNHLRIIVSNSADLESGIEEVLYRVLDGQTGAVIFDWEDFLFLNPAYPTFIIPTTEKVVALPEFDSSRSIIVEVQSKNRAGLSSPKTIRFLPLELDVTPPTTPTVHTTYFSSRSAQHPNTILLDVGLIEDPESPLTEVAYRIVNQESQQRNQQWRRLDKAGSRSHVFPGAIDLFTAPPLSPNGVYTIQVRSTNQQGLSTITSSELNVEQDDTPPVLPFLKLGYSEGISANSGILQIVIGESYDPQTFISQVRYRVSDLQQADSSLVSWQDIELSNRTNQFRGASIEEDILALTSTSRFLVDVEVINGVGLSTRSSAIIDRTLLENTQSEGSPKTNLEVFYFAQSNSLRSNEFELLISQADNYSLDVDSLQYRIDFGKNNGGGDETNSAQATASWSTVINPTVTSSGHYQIYTPLSASTETFTARIQVRAFYSNGDVSELEKIFTATNRQDTTPPTVTNVDAIYYPQHHTNKANTLDLLLSGIEDTETRLSEISYRVIDTGNASNPLSEWTPIEHNSLSGLFTPKTISIDLPEFTESTTLNVDVRAINGANLQATTQVLVPIVVDVTPPTFDALSIYVQEANSPGISDKLLIHIFGVYDQESYIDSLEYRVLSDKNADELLIDWTALDIDQTNVVRQPEIALDLPKTTDENSLVVELRARNIAGLTSVHTEELKRDVDTSSPQLQQISAAYKLTQSGSGYLLIEPGSFRDPESQIVQVEYRIVDDQNASTVYLPWRSIPIQKDIRVQVAPITIPRQLLPFDATQTIAVEFRTTNGVGISDIRRTTTEIPGDTTPAQAPTLVVRHRNGYDPRYPNTIEIQIGPSNDDQSTIQNARYRVINLASREELLSWTDLSVPFGGVFPGKVLFTELPFLSRDVDMQVEVEITNSANLIRTVSETVTIQVAGDVSPPSLSISSHYISNELAIVLDELSDTHSRIQRVEYRLVDNVDQSILTDWKDLFEIVNPQERYSRQAYRVTPPEVRDGRAVKVEVRATNGAGLQSTMSRTLLYQKPESN